MENYDKKPRAIPLINIESRFGPTTVREENETSDSERAKVMPDAGSILSHLKS